MHHHIIHIKMTECGNAVLRHCPAFLLGPLRQNRQELIPAIPVAVRLSEMADQDASKGLQHLIPACVTVHTVEELEVVHIEEQDGCLLVQKRRVILFQRITVLHAGQCIMLSSMLRPDAAFPKFLLRACQLSGKEDLPAVDVN